MTRRARSGNQSSPQDHQESLQPVLHHRQDSLPLELDESLEVRHDTSQQTHRTQSFYLDIDHPRVRIHNIRDAVNKFQVACHQLILLTNCINEAVVRYERAKKDKNNLVRYIIHLKLKTLEGVRNMFYFYAREKSEIIENLERFLLVTNGIAWNDGLMDESFEHDAENNDTTSDSGMSIVSDPDSEEDSFTSTTSNSESSDNVIYIGSDTESLMEFQ